MERKEAFSAQQVCSIHVRLAWAQFEIYADDVETIQVIATGEDNYVNDLRIELKNGDILIEQPQYGISLNITDLKWMNVTVRVPFDFIDPIQCSTISGLLIARKLLSHSVTLETVSGSLSAQNLQAKEISLKAVSGDIQGDYLTSIQLRLRCVSGEAILKRVSVKELSCYCVSGRQEYALCNGFSKIDVTAVSGNVVVSSPVDTVNVHQRSVSGHVVTEGITLSEEDTVPQIHVTGVSSDLKVVYIPVKF